MAISGCASTSGTLEHELSGLKAQVSALRHEQELLTARLDDLREVAAASATPEQGQASSSSVRPAQEVRPTLAVVRLEPGASGTDPANGAQEGAGAAQPGKMAEGPSVALRDSEASPEEPSSADPDGPRPEIIVHGDKVRTLHVDETSDTGRAPARR